MNIRYSRRALLQLASVHEYLEARNSATADNVTASIRSTIARLKEMPLLGKPTDEVNVHVIIEPEYLYRVFYGLEGVGAAVLLGRKPGLELARRLPEITPQAVLGLARHGTTP